MDYSVNQGFAKLVISTDNSSTWDSRTRETPNLSTDADSSTDILIFAGVKKGADSIFF